MDIGAWLRSLGLQQYEPAFRNNDIDAEVLPKLTTEDLIAIGIMSIGLALVIIAGHMDLSVESVAALSAMAVGILFCSGGIGIDLQLNPAWLAVPVSLLLALAVGGLIGAFYGFLIV